MFIGRERELKTLNSLYDTNTFQFPVVYGRRRVGKTSLLSKFASGRPCVFFTAVEDSARANLVNLSREIVSIDNSEVNPDFAPIFADFQTAFEHVFSRSLSQRFVFIIDEYPYLAKADPSISSILQMLVDRYKDRCHLFLVLCGSSLSFMKEQVLGEKSPLYGRRTAQIKLRPFDFFDARRFFPDTPLELAAHFYGIAGGVPLYLQEFDGALSLEDNLRRSVLSPSSLLFEEPQNLLKQEVSKAAQYNAIIAAIAQGKTANNEIATTVGMQSAEITYYLKELQRLGLVERVAPIIGSGRRPYYRITDNLFSFWYRFVLPGKPALERGITRRVLSRIDEYMSDYLGPVFERICADWLWRQNTSGTLSCGFDDVGTWWGPNPATHAEEEIDLVCVADGKPCILAECKWRNEKTGPVVAEKLIERGRLIGAPETAPHYVFSKSGFTPGCVTLANKDERLYFITFNQMCDQ